jgi:hypothetical protein
LTSHSKSSSRGIIPHIVLNLMLANPTPCFAQDLSFLLRGFLRLRNDILCLGDLLLAGSALLCAFDLVFELLESVGDSLAEGREDGFGFFNCGTL